MPRRDYLYEMPRWEINATVRGYHQRQRPGWTQARWIAYCSAFCMGGKDIPRMEEWHPFPWEAKADEPSPADVSPEDEKRMLALIERENKKRK